MYPLLRFSSVANTSGALNHRCSVHLQFQPELVMDSSRQIQFLLALTASHLKIKLLPFCFCPRAFSKASPHESTASKCGSVHVFGVAFNQLGTVTSGRELQPLIHQRNSSGRCSVSSKSLTRIKHLLPNGAIS